MITLKIFYLAYLSLKHVVAINLFLYFHVIFSGTNLLNSFLNILSKLCHVYLYACIQNFPNQKKRERLSMGFTEKNSHFDLKCWVIGETKIRPGIPPVTHFFRSKCLHFFFQCWSYGALCIQKKVRLICSCKQSIYRVADQI